MPRSTLVLASVVLVAGCFAGNPSPSRTAGAAASPPLNASSSAPVSAAPTSTPVPTPTLVPPGACPTGSPIAVEVFGDADPACFGAADVEIRGWLDSLPAIGFMPPGIAPGWLYFPTVERALWSQELGPDQECLDEAAPCSYYFVQIDPASGLELVGPPRWVIVTGHLQDPAAETCHYVYPDDWTEPPYDDADAVATCRTRFVGVATRDAP